MDTAYEELLAQVERMYRSSGMVPGASRGVVYGYLRLLDDGNSTWQLRTMLKAVMAALDAGDQPTAAELIDYLSTRVAVFGARGKAPHDAASADFMAAAALDPRPVVGALQ